MRSRPLPRALKGAIVSGHMISRRGFLARTVTLLAAPLAAEAQPTGKVYRIGYLAIASPTASGPSMDAFRQGLREFGWVEGQNVSIEYRFADGETARLPGLAAELVRLNVDLIFAVSSPPAKAAQRATDSVPIVFSGVADAIGVGLVPRLARPGGNITGFTTSNVELSGKRLELLKEAVPKLTHVAVFVNPTNPQVRAFRRETTAAAVPLGLTLEFIDVADPGQLPKAFAAITSQAQALLILPDPVIGTGMAQVRIAELALEIRLPTMERSRRFADVGGLMGYGTNLQEREAARYVDRILRGAKPGDLPVQQPTKFELVINLKTAKALGLTIPPSLLLRADQVIE